MKISNYIRTGSYNVHQFEIGKYQNIPVKTVSEGALWQGNVDDMRILLTPIMISFHIGDKHRAVFDFRPGYPTDFGSVPERLRGLVDNDDIHMRDGFLCHDLLYNIKGAGGKYLSFEWAQKIMREVGILTGAKKRTAWTAWFATNFFSRKLWSGVNRFDSEAAQFASVRIEEI